MTRLFTEGAEMQDTIFWDYWYGDKNSSISVQSGTPYISPYYYRVYEGVGRYVGRILGTTISECYLRIRFYIDASTVYTLIRVFELRKGTTTIVAYVDFNATRQMTANVTTVGVVGTSSLVFNPHQWYLLEAHFLEANVNGRFTVYVDGNLLIDYTGDTQPAADTTFDSIYHFTVNSAHLFLDDLAINDTTGDVDNSWCGDGVVIRLTPSGSGTINQWSNSGSTSGSSNYQYVDEYPSDGNSTYVYCSASNTEFQDRYALSSFDGTGKVISRIYAESRASKIYGVEGGIKIGYLPEGGTTVMSGSFSLPIGAYTQIVGTSGSINPVTGLAWTEDDINALEYVCEII